MRGGEEKLWGYRFDGSVEVVRQNAFDLAWITLFIIDEVVLYQLHSCEEWLNLAGMGETEELRSFTSWIYFLGTDCAPNDPKVLLDLAINGESHELRFGAALRYVLSEEPSGETLMDLALHGEGEESRDAAATGLLTLWEGELVQISLEELYGLALNGGTPQLRRAAGEALEAIWERELKEGRLMISDIPRQSAAEPYSLEQALIIFAAENTVAHPELARAAAAPLSTIWGG